MSRDKKSKTAYTDDEACNILSAAVTNLLRTMTEDDLKRKCNAYSMVHNPEFLKRELHDYFSSFITRKRDPHTSVAINEEENLHDSYDSLLKELDKSRKLFFTDLEGFESWDEYLQSNNVNEA